MEGFSAVDGFVEISECLADMIKYVANEPSVGLFYIQQHTESATVNLNGLKNNIATRLHETTLQTEDLEECIPLVKSMKECGFFIADEMIKDIKESLVIISSKQPERDLLYKPTSGFKIGRASSWSRSAASAQQDSEKTNFIASVFKSAKEKASTLKWPQHDIGESVQRENVLSVYSEPIEVQSAASACSTLPDAEADELPLSSPIAEELPAELQVDVDLPCESLLSMSGNYDSFKADKEAQLEKWLEGTEH